MIAEAKVYRKFYKTKKFFYFHMSIIERLKEYIDYKQISVSAFEKSIGMSNATLRNALVNKGTIGANKLEKIIETYSDLNPAWLITGEGEMLKNPSVGHTQIGKKNTINRSPIAIPNDTEELSRLKKENEQLRQENSAVKEELLKAKDEIINLLKNKK